MKLFNVKSGILAAVILVLLIILAMITLAIIREVKTKTDPTDAISMLKEGIEADRAEINLKFDSLYRITNEAMNVLSYLELNTFAQSQLSKKYEKQAAEIVAASNDARIKRFPKFREEFWNRYEHGYYTNFPDR